MKISGKEILKFLIQKYNASVLSKQGSAKNLHIRFDLEKQLKEYYDYEHYKEALSLEEDIFFYEKQGWVKVYRDDSMLKMIELNLNKTDEIYKHLGMRTENSKKEELLALLERYRNNGFDIYIDEVEKRIGEYKPYKSLVFEDAEDEELLLRSLSGIMALEDDIYEKVFSAKYLGNSKNFEKVRNRLVSILKEFFDCDEEEPEDILAHFHIMHNSGQMIIKGNGVITIGNSLLNMADFKQGLTLTSADVTNIRQVILNNENVLTIENLTTFYQCDKENTTIIYLGGYHNRTRRNFLSELYRNYPQIKYCHFGDIDAGGFYILDHLIEKTGIPFIPFMMDIDTLVKYRNNALPLTANDRKRLEKILNDGKHKEVISYMLDNNVKLEQEQIDAADFNRKDG